MTEGKARHDAEILEKITYDKAYNKKDEKIFESVSASPVNDGKKEREENAERSVNDSWNGVGESSV